MITLILLTLAVLWIVALRRYPSLFAPRKAVGLSRSRHHLGTFWVDVVPAAGHHEASSMQEAV